MSEGTAKAERRALRKAVGDDAISLMGAMSGILHDQVFPVQQLHDTRLHDLHARLERLEGHVMMLARPWWTRWWTR